MLEFIIGETVYRLSVITFILVFIYLQKNNRIIKNEDIPINKLGNKKLIWIYLTIFFATTIYFIIPTNLSFYISTIVTSDKTILTGILMALTSLMGVISGIFFIKVYTSLKDKMSTLLFLSFSLSMIIIFLHINVFFLTISLMISGFSLGIGIPYFNKEMIQYSNKRMYLPQL